MDECEIEETMQYLTKSRTYESSISPSKKEMTKIYKKKDLFNKATEVGLVAFLIGEALAFELTFMNVLLSLFLSATN